MNKKWWLGILMLFILVVGLSIASVNAERGSEEVGSDATGVVSMTEEEGYESLRQDGASEEVIQALREVNRKFNDGVSDEEAEALVNELNLLIQELEGHDQGTESSGR